MFKPPWKTAEIKEVTSRCILAPQPSSPVVRPRYTLPKAIIYTPLNSFMLKYINNLEKEQYLSKKTSFQVVFLQYKSAFKNLGFYFIHLGFYFVTQFQANINST